MRYSLRSLGLGATALFGSTFLLVASANGVEPCEGIDQICGAQLANELRTGGLVIYFRHASTESDYADQLSADPLDCSTQRVLSEFGWNQALQIGEGFDEVGIPVGDVISSEYCRAWQTASLAFGRYEKDANLNFLPVEDYTDEQIALMSARLTPMLSAIPAWGTNTVIVAHDDYFEAATGIYPDPQGLAHVVRPHGDGTFEIVADVLPEEWSELAQAEPSWPWWPWGGGWGGGGGGGGGWGGWGGW